MLCATAATLAGLAALPQAAAQPAQDGHWVRVTPADQPLAGETDPPMRVGRVARVDGNLSMRPASAEDWTEAERNYPVASGTSYWSPEGSRARFDLASGHVAIDGGTELRIDGLDETGLRATLAAGEAYLRLRTPLRGESWMVRTPRGVVALDGTGRYAIQVGDASSPTRVTVLQGSARVLDPGPAMTIGPGQAALISGEDSFAGRLVPADPDGFTAAMVASEQVPGAPIQPVRPPAVVAQIPGGTDLGAYGTWAEAEGYGPVWYPRVDPDWVPYRDGQWSWVQPWGWTWVDNAPWGFAPSHYGRWSEVGGRWGWLPGPAVYAPATVSFWGIGAGAALAAGSVGWAPLRPGEPYRPWYRATPRYRDAMNAGPPHRPDWPRGDGPRHPPGFDQRPGATVVPAGIMAASRPVGPAALRPSPRVMGAARPVEGLAPLPPTAATAGISPAMAQRMNLVPAPPGLAVSPRAAAPGPVLGDAPGRGPNARWAPPSGGNRGWASPPPVIVPSSQSAQPGLRGMPPGSEGYPPTNRIAPGGLAPGAPGPASGMFPPTGVPPGAFPGAPAGPAGRTGLAPGTGQLPPNQFAPGPGGGSGGGPQTPPALPPAVAGPAAPPGAPSASPVVPRQTDPAGAAIAPGMGGAARPLVPPGVGTGPAAAPSVQPPVNQFAPPQGGGVSNQFAPRPAAPPGAVMPSVPGGPVRPQAPGIGTPGPAGAVPVQPPVNQFAPPPRDRPNPFGPAGQSGGMGQPPAGPGGSAGMAPQPAPQPTPAQPPLMRPPQASPGIPPMGTMPPPQIVQPQAVPPQAVLPRAMPQPAPVQPAPPAIARPVPQPIPVQPMPVQPPPTARAPQMPLPNVTMPPVAAPRPVPMQPVQPPPVQPSPAMRPPQMPPPQMPPPGAMAPPRPMPQQPPAMPPPNAGGTRSPPPAQAQTPPSGGQRRGPGA